MPIPSFKEEGHVYTYGGRHLESVTQVLSGERMLPSYEWLDPWYRDRGRATHKAAALLLLGRLDQESLDPEVLPFIQNLERFIEAGGWRPLVVEQPLCDPVYGYAGTPDALLKSDDGLLLPDWKATTAEPGHSIQVACYYDLLMLAASAGEIPISPEELRGARLAIVPLNKPNPAAKFVADDPSERRRLLAVFHAASTARAWRQANVKGDCRS